MKKFSLIGFEISGEKVLKRMGVGFFLYFILKAKGIITMPILTRFLGKEGYGTLSIITVTVSMLTPIIKLISPYGFKVHATHLTDKEEIGKIYYSSLIPAIIFSVFNLAVFYFLPLSGINEKIHIYKMFICVMILVYVLREYALAIPEAYQKARVIAYFNIADRFLGAILSVVLVVLGYYVTGVLYGTLIAAIGATAVLFYYIFSELKPTLNVDWSKTWEYLKLSLPLLPLSFSMWAVQSVDQYFVAYYHSTKEVGIYAAAVTIADSILVISISMGFAFGATMLKLWNTGEKEQFFIYLNKTVKWVFALVVLAFVCFYFNSNMIIRVLASKKFSAASSVLPILVGAKCFYVLFNIYERIYYVLKKPYVILIAFVVTLLANVGLNILLIPKYVVEGASWATLISYLVAFISILILARRELGARAIPLKNLSAPLIAGAVGLGIFLLVMSIKMSEITAYAIALAFTIIFAVGYIGILWKTSFTDAEERTKIINYVKNILLKGKIR